MLGHIKDFDPFKEPGEAGSWLVPLKAVCGANSNEFKRRYLSWKQNLEQKLVSEKDWKILMQALIKLVNPENFIEFLETDKEEWEVQLTDLLKDEEGENLEGLV